MDNFEQERFNYEVSFIVKNEEDASFLARIFEKNKAEIINAGVLVKMNAAYQIRKQNLVYLGTTLFLCDSECVEKLSDDLRLEDRLLRFMIRRVKNEASRETRTPVVLREKIERKRFIPSKVANKNFEAVLTNEALQEKIDELK